MKELLRLTMLVPVCFVLSQITTAAEPAEAVDEHKDMILILDASGSMWGQIDGVNKIVIAKDVVESLVRSFEPSQRLGFVAYGHRREGDCSDIETLADVGTDRDGVIASLRNLTARGKTPLSRSVEHAAETLDYTRNAASVILVSDGLETCDVDPCALARTLEEQGLDFTVHVVGFDVSEQERKGLACIADETGGTFVAADNAEELADALSSVADTGGPRDDGTGVPVPSQLALKATILSGGPLIQSQLDWQVTEAGSGETVFTATDTGTAETELLPGQYVATATWSGWENDEDVKRGELAFDISPQQHKVITVPIDLGLDVSLSVPDSTREGVEFDVTWTGPDDLGAYLHVASEEDGPRRAIYFASAAKARASAGVDDVESPATVKLGAPSTEGLYEVRYVLDQPRLILSRKPLTVTDGGFSVQAPDEAPVSSTITVDWSGDATPGDFITVTEAGAARAFANGFTSKVTSTGQVELTLPSEPGDYEIRYVLANGYTTYPGMQYAVQASAPITLMPVSVAISGPASVVGGSPVGVSVELPSDWEDDLISIAAVGAAKPNRDARITLGRADITDGVVSLQAPNIEGDYELIYFLVPGNSPIARQPLTVTRAQATVSAPSTVRIGEEFEVSYTGPAYRGDRVVIVPADVPDIKMWSIGSLYGFAVEAGATQALGTLRNNKYTDAGTYEVRYVTGLQHQVLARAQFTLVE